MTFAPGPVREFDPPLSPGEVFRPTRVVYRHVENRKITTRIFSTEARAFDFAADQAEVIVIQDAFEPPPAQDFPVFRAFTNIGRRRGVAIGRAKARSGKTRRLP